MSRRKMNILETVMHYRSIMLLLLVTLVCFGIYSLVNMPKNEFPTFTVRQGVVIGVYPGATSEEVEEQLTKPLEDFLWEFKEIKKTKTHSQSKDGLSITFVELNDNIKKKDEFWSKFKIRLNQFKGNLPQGVLALMANDDFGDTSALLITLESKNKTYRQLHEYITDLKDRLRSIPSIANMRVTGEQQEQINVYIDRNKLSAYGINSATLMATLSSQGMTVISGAVNNKSTKRPIHIVSKMDSEYDIAQQIIYSDPMGNTIRLRDVADIKREYPDASSFIKNNDTKCIVLSLEMNEGNNIVKFGKKVKKIIEEYKKELPNDVHIYPITDQSNVVNTSVMNFLKELSIAIIAVIIVIMLLLPIRVAAVAASTIPITIFISLGLFFALGVELNTVTLAALIVTLGMIVDNSIVIIDCYIEYIDQGMSRWHAASKSALEFFSSIFSATLAISITFIPLMLTMRGMFYDFVKWFPISVLIVLATSLAVAVFVIPLFQFNFIKNGLNKKDEGKESKTFLDIIQRYYNKLINCCFRHPFYTISTGVVLTVLGAYLFLHQPQQLMPIADRDQFAVEIFLPSGTAIERTEMIADSLRHLMQKDERVKNITTFYGSGSPRFQTSYAPQIGGSNFAQFIVNTSGAEETEELLDKFTPLYANYFPEAKINIRQLRYSDVTHPIEIRFYGEDLNELHALTNATIQLMNKNHDFSMITTSFEDNLPGLKVVLDRDEMNNMGLNKTLTSINLALRFGDGIPMTTVWEGDYPVEVMLKDINASKQEVDDLKNTVVSGIVPGIDVPLRQVAQIVPDWNYGSIQHRNGIRCASVYAELERGVNTNIATDHLLAEIKENIKIPESVKMNVGGQRESDQEVEPQIYSGLAISVVIIFIILIFHFKDIRLSVLIMFSLLFSLPGTALGLIIMQQPMSITGVLGIISLMGIIVRNGIIMIDYAEELRIKQHLSAKHAALHAAIRRMRPIFLTSAAASMGVVPMVISNTPMWGPMGSVVCFGTIVSMFFIITMIPIGYWLIFRLKDKRRQLKNEKNRSDKMMLNLLSRLGLLLLFLIPVTSAEAQQTISLKECQKMALENNVKLKNALLEVEGAKQQKREAFGNYLPQVTLTGTYFNADRSMMKKSFHLSDENQQQIATVFSQLGLDPTILSALPTSYSLSLLDNGVITNAIAMLPLYTGGKITTVNKLSKVNYEVKQIQYHQTRDQIEATTEIYYNQLLALLETQKTLQTVQRHLMHIHQDAENAFKAGVRNKNDVLTVELKQQELQSQLLKVENGIQLSRMLLQQYIGLKNDSFEIDTLMLEKIPDPMIYKINHLSALKDLDNVQLLNKNVDAKKLETKLSRSELLPTLAIGVAGNYYTMDDNEMHRSNVIGLATVNIPISSLWTKNHALKKSKIMEKKAFQNREDQKQLLLINMQKHYNDLLEAYQQIKIAEKSLETAAENLRLNRNYYQAGTVSISDLLNAQSQESNAHTQYTQSRVQYLIARTSYLQSTGQSIE